MQNLKPVWHAILDIYSAYGAVVIAGGVGSLCHSGIWGKIVEKEERRDGERRRGLKCGFCVRNGL